MPFKTCSSLVCALASSVILLLGGTAGAGAQEPRHFSFGYDQPHTTGYGIAGDLFSAKLSN